MSDARGRTALTTSPAGTSKRIAAVLFCALLIRTAIPVAAILSHHDYSVFRSADTESYLLPSQSLLASGQFFTHGVPDLHRTPGYPLFLLPGLLTNRLYPVTMALQIVLSTLTVFLVYCIALRLGGQKAALCASCLYSIEPLSVIYASHLLTETVFTFFVMLFLHEAIRSLEKPTAGRVLASSLAVIAAAYVRPVGLLIPFITAAVILPFAFGGRRMKEAAGYLPLFLVPCVLAFGAWSLRNYREAGYPGFSSVTDEDMYFHHAAAILAIQEGRSFGSVQEQLGMYSDEQYLASHPDQAQWSRAAQYAYMGHEGRRLTLENLRIYGRIHLRGMALVIAEPGSVGWSQLFGKYPRSGGGLLHIVTDNGVSQGLKILRTRYSFAFYLTIIFGLILFVYLASACVGIILIPREARTAATLMIVLVVYFIFIAGGPEAADSRFRHPAMPMICIFAGYALSRIGTARNLPT